MANRKTPAVPKSRATTRTQSSAPRPAMPSQGLRPSTPKQVDPSSRAYKQAARKYTGFMVAMPILLVTSYVLFDRLVLGNQAKSLTPPPIETTAPTTEREHNE